ncbi:MAG: phosphate ABC transporter substrate-binding protein PstS family protein [Nitriliruptorales bacterium]|nr:phosphate ABC transporter substrate-binding protein PstS family protein [Nitriliruptorales bacterium]
MSKNWQVLLGLVVVLALITAACGGSEGSANEELGEGGDEEGAGGEGGELSGSIEVDGSSTVAPLTDAIAEEYAVEQSNVTVNVGVSGTGGGFERFCAGETDISDASRPIKDEEAEICADAGVEYVELRVGTDALTMVTTPETDWVDCLTTEEVTKIFGEEDAATTWSEVNPEFPDEPLEVFAPGTDSGTYDFMVEDVLGLEGSRQDFNASEDDNIIAQGVIGTPGSWGFFGFAYFQESADQLKALEYDAGDGCVAPSVESAQDDSYQMTRPLFIYVQQEALERPEVEGFVTYYLDTVPSLIDEVGYIGVPDEDLEAAKSDLQEAIDG